jgi:hypothetical protein
MTFPTEQLATTALDAAADDPRIARTQLLRGLEALNQIIAHAGASGRAALAAADAASLQAIAELVPDTDVHAFSVFLDSVRAAIAAASVAGPLVEDDQTGELVPTPKPGLFRLNSAGQVEVVSTSPEMVSLATVKQEIAAALQSFAAAGGPGYDLINKALVKSYHQWIIHQSFVSGPTFSPWNSNDVGTGSATWTTGTSTAKHLGVVDCYGGTVANSGKRLSTGNAFALIGGERISVRLMPLRMDLLKFAWGISDATSGDPTEGLLGEISAAGTVAKTAYGGTVTAQTAPSFTPSDNVWLRAECRVETSREWVVFELFDDDDVSLWRCQARVPLTDNPLGGRVRILSSGTDPAIKIASLDDALFIPRREIF